MAFGLKFHWYFMILSSKFRKARTRILSYSEIVVCNRPKSVMLGNLSKNCCVWAAQLPTSSKLKIKFDPSLDRSWPECFKIMIQKIHPGGVIWGGLFPSPSWNFKQENLLSDMSIYIVVLGLDLQSPPSPPSHFPKLWQPCCAPIARARVWVKEGLLWCYSTAACLA